MNFEWDPFKARKNLAKHGVDFADAATVFDDVGATTIEDPGHDEERYVLLGMDALGRSWSSHLPLENPRSGLSRHGKQQSVSVGNMEA